MLSVATLVLAAAALAVLRVPASFGAYTAKIANITDSAATDPYFTCTSYATDSVGAVRATFDYPLGETTDTGSAADVSGSGNTGTYSSAGVTATANTTVCPRDSKGYVATFNGTSGYVLGPTASVAGPSTFTIEAWFKTSTAAGKIIGFGSSNTATASSNYDRHLYIGSDGYLYFGVYPNAVVTITNKASTQPGADTTTVSDGLWHFAVATLSSSGMALYLDGKLVATNTATTTAQSFTGYWRVGFDNMSGWTNSPSSGYFNGQLGWAAAYNSYALSATQVAQQYAAGH